MNRKHISLNVFMRGGGLSRLKYARFNEIPYEKKSIENIYFVYLFADFFYCGK